MKTAGFPTKRRREAVLSPSGGAGLPQLSPATGRACKKPGETASALEVSPTDGGRRNAPRLPSPPDNLPPAPRIDYTREEPADTGRGKGREPPAAGRARQGGTVRPRQGPARQGQQRWPSFHAHRNHHTLRQGPSSLVSLIRENEVQKGSKKSPMGS